MHWEPRLDEIVTSTRVALHDQLVRARRESTYLFRSQSADSSIKCSSVRFSPPPPAAVPPPSGLFPAARGVVQSGCASVDMQLLPEPCVCTARRQFAWEA